MNPLFMLIGIIGDMARISVHKVMINNLGDHLSFPSARRAFIES